MSEAFSRAGLQEGQTTAWVVYLPEAEGLENDLGHLQPVAKENPAFSEQLSTLLDQLDWPSEMSGASYSIEGARQLGIDADGWDHARVHESIIAHILMADDQSSSHR